jgi:hypothetical protein
MKSTAKKKIIFITIIGGFILPIIFQIVSAFVNPFLQIFNIKPLSSTLYDQFYFAIINFWRFLFSDEVDHLAYHCDSCYSKITVVADLTIFLFFAFVSYLLAKNFIKDRQAENFSIC